ncbi:MAG TPA: hypothetical protein PJ991_09340 [Kiritimatiellia bacterium]|nr:hypothetical protein [Kiritimatiellia bacterium]
MNMTTFIATTGLTFTHDYYRFILKRTTRLSWARLDKMNSTVGVHPPATFVSTFNHTNDFSIIYGICIWTTFITLSSDSNSPVSVCIPPLTTITRFVNDLVMELPVWIRECTAFFALWNLDPHLLILQKTTSAVYVND